MDMMTLSGAGELTRVLDEVGGDDAARAFVEELLQGLASADNESGAKATALGRARWLAGRSAGDAVADALSLGFALEAALASRGLDEAGQAAVRRLVVQAAPRVADGHEEARRTRRDHWLSYLSHEMRNSLNTLVNSLWVLRNAEQPKQQARISDMADRAVKKLEHQVREMRELEDRSRGPAPGKPD
jgi:hypothetical protein